MECEDTRAICRDMKRVNAKVIALVGGPMQESGLPDRYIAHLVWSGWIEFKSPHRKVEKHQAQQIRDLRARGVNACVVRFHADGSTHVEELCDEPQGSRSIGKITNRDGRLLLELLAACESLTLIAKWGGLEIPVASLQEARAWWNGLKQNAEKRPRVSVYRGEELIRTFS